MRPLFGFPLCARALLDAIIVTNRAATNTIPVFLIIISSLLILHVRRIAIDVIVDTAQETAQGV
jgi:hypothetical protein